MPRSLANTFAALLFAVVMTMAPLGKWSQHPALAQQPVLAQQSQQQQTMWQAPGQGGAQTQSPGPTIWQAPGPGSSQTQPAAPQQTQTQTEDSGISTLYASRPYVSASTRQDQYFYDWLPLQPGQEKLEKLTLTVINGVQGRPKFKWLRLQIGGYMMATEKDFPKGTNRATIDVSGKLQPGTNQIICEAGGVVGASMQWFLTTSNPYITNVHPINAAQGQVISIYGGNLDMANVDEIVYFNGVAGNTVFSSDPVIRAQVPDNAEPGPNELIVSVAGIKTQPLMVNVYPKPVPELLSVLPWVVVPGGQSYITGRNFAPNPQNNQVYIGGISAQIVNGDENNLTVIVPLDFNANLAPLMVKYNIPVYVVSNGIRSANTLNMDIGAYEQGPGTQYPTMPGDADP